MSRVLSASDFELSPQGDVSVNPDALTALRDKEAETGVMCRGERRVVVRGFKPSHDVPKVAPKLN